MGDNSGKNSCPALCSWEMISGDEGKGGGERRKEGEEGTRRKKEGGGEGGKEG